MYAYIIHAPYRICIEALIAHVIIMCQGVRSVSRQWVYVFTLAFILLRARARVCMCVCVWGGAACI